MKENSFSFGHKLREIYAGDRPPKLMPERFKGIKNKKPALIGVQFMGDLFHESIPFHWVDDVFSVFNLCPQHTFLVLTKRIKRMLEWYNQTDISGWGSGDYNSNTWLGVTICTQDELWKVEELMKIPAAVRFISVEPILGEIDFDFGATFIEVATPDGFGYVKKPLPDWIIIGQETGPGARPAKAEWFNDIIRQCRAVGVPVFVKKAPAGVEIIRGYPKNGT